MTICQQFDALQDALEKILCYNLQHQQEIANASITTNLIKFKK
jgi:hypothetical protein